MSRSFDVIEVKVFLTVSFWRSEDDLHGHHISQTLPVASLSRFIGQEPTITILGLTQSLAHYSALITSGVDHGPINKN